MLDTILTMIFLYLGIGNLLLAMDYRTDKQDYLAIYKMNGIVKLIRACLTIVLLWPAVVIRWLINTHGGEK